jgi:Flp pilus assembly protein TadD
VVVLGALVLIAGTVGREYFLGFIRPQAAQPRLDERVPALLEQARLALGRGDFDNARAELAKASVLAEAEPQVVTATAQLELAQAEQSWLLLRAGAALEAARAAAAKAPASRKRLSEAEAVAEAKAAEQQVTEKKQLEQAFQDRMAKAKAAVASAVMRAPNALDVVRARVDALRLEGQLKEARTLVSVLSAEASDPANAYSLGALDLAEGESGYPSAIDRLRVAARAEEALGKARGLLVLVLCQTGDAPGASAELEKLETLAPRHRALAVLRSLVDVAKSRVAPPPSEPAPVARRPAPSPSSATVPAAGDDTQALLTHAASLHRQGDLSGAERVYQNVLTKSPSNIPALSGLGDIARQRRATATAAAFYDQVLKQDPNHVSTLMARADLYWHSGNRQAAVAMYRRALGQVGPSDALGQRALRRIEEFDKNGEGSGTEGSSESEGAESPPTKSSAPGEEGEDEGAAPNPLEPEPIEVDEPEPGEGQGSPQSPSTPPKTAPKAGAPVPPASKQGEGSDDTPSDESTETP